KLIKRDTLLTEVWGYKSEVMTHTLETHIYRLRKKISLNCTSQTLLVSESGGYRLDL
ncbi:MAG: helix-turn-helix domain-containing protein, partial [Paracoccaceae bacterium]|nr:helix-turn-helix domain-containing protein [Paracoccaceae bacterium]